MPSSPTSDAGSRRLVAPAIALLAVIGLGVAALGSSEESPPTATPTGTVSEPTTPATEGSATSPAPERERPTLARRTAGDPRAKGEVDAPVVMVEWADFQCPFCGRFARETAPELVEQYVDEGVLRIEWRDFPYLGPESEVAAHASRAAAEQDAFWEFHDALFAEPREPNSGALTEDAMVALADDLGLDTEAFRATMTAPATATAVEEEFQHAQQLGVNGTPAFLVGGRPIMGAQPLEAFVQAIEAAEEAA